MQTSAQRQIETIYRQLAQSAGFSGFRPGFLLTVAAVAAVATATLRSLSAQLDIRDVALAWVCLAAVLAVAVALVIVIPALRSESTLKREAAHGVVRQMVFPLIAGAAVTAAVLLHHREAVIYLPAVWLLIFGLAVASLSSLIRHRIEFAALFYFGAAALAYFEPPAHPGTFVLLTGVPFTLGHLLTAWILRGRHGSRLEGSDVPHD